MYQDQTGDKERPLNALALPTAWEICITEVEERDINKGKLSQPKILGAYSVM